MVEEPAEEFRRPFLHERPDNGLAVETVEWPVYHCPSDFGLGSTTYLAARSSMPQSHLSTASIFAPREAKNSTESSLPLSAARTTGVRLSYPSASMGTPETRRNCNVSRLPVMAAI